MIKYSVDDPSWEVTAEELLAIRTCGTSEVPPDLGWSQYFEGKTADKGEVWMRTHDGKLWGRGVKDE